MENGVAHEGTTRWRGDRAENMAAEYLVLRGYQILLRNARRGEGEMDIVARTGNVLAFVEVRLRSNDSFATAAASIDRRKRTRLRSCARALLRQCPELTWPGRTCRFDAIVVQVADDSLTLRHLRSVAL